MKNIIRNKNTYLTVTFFAALAFSLIFQPSAAFSSSIWALLTSFSLPNYIILLCPVIMQLFLSRKITENETFPLLSLLYTTMLILIHTEFSRANATLFFASVAILLLSAVCINAGQPFASLVLIPGLFLRQFGTGYIFMCYIPVLLMLLTKTAQTEKDDKKPFLFTVGAYLYAVIFAVILFAKGNLRISLSPVEFRSSPVEITKLVAGIILVLIACVMFIIRTLPVIRNGNLLLKLSTVLFAVFPVAGCIISLMTGIISASYTTVILVTILIYIAGNINISANNPGLPLLPEKRGFILGLCGAAMCILIF